MTSSSTFDILDIAEIRLDEVDKEVFSFHNPKAPSLEKFRSAEIDTIIRIFNEMKEKAIKNSKEGNFQKQSTERKKDMGKKVEDVFDLFNFN